MFTAFDPQPAMAELPRVFPSPFRPGTPHPLAALAAEETKAFVQNHVSPSAFEGAHGGKMMGVLVVRGGDGRVGYLRGFAGMLRGSWVAPGFVPPVFDRATFEQLCAEQGPRITQLDRDIVTMRTAHNVAAAQLRATIAEQRERSRALHAELLATYCMRNAQGETTTLAHLFAPGLPIGGAGDCAGPKLLAAAFAMDATPLALAEFWWGASPPGGGRQHGVFYPACRGRCGKILPFMLEGIDCEPAPDVGMKAVADDAPPVLYADDALMVVDKPCGLLSVPGRGPRRQDSVEHRLQQRLQLRDASWPRLVHRLDVATSGLLVAAMHKEAYVAMQRQFSQRSVTKRYIALLCRNLEQSRGTVDLPLRVDLDDRPRQIHCERHGRPSLTDWEVLEHHEHRCRVALYPKTGRTHQLRVHAAHPQGLDAPIVGDLLYGFGGERLMLHAESITFAHPLTNERMTFRSPCPF